jgi:hypothetical protein
LGTGGVSRRRGGRDDDLRRHRTVTDCTIAGAGSSTSACSGTRAYAGACADTSPHPDADAHTDSDANPDAFAG